MSSSNIQTAAQRLAVIRGRLLLSNPSQFNTSPGSFVAGLMMGPLAIGDVEQQARTFMLSLGDSILNILATENDQQTLTLIAAALQTTVTSVLAQLSQLLDNWGSNFNAPRNQPTYATGSLQFGTPVAPASDIPIGIGIVTATSDSIAFLTTAAATMYAASASNYFNPNNYQYAISVAARAQQAGSAGNAASGAINTIQTSISGIQFVTNATAFTGGQDLETDQAYGQRLLLIWLAQGRLTAAGIQFYAESMVPGIEDVYVAGANDPLAQRGGARTDVWYQGQVESGVTETFTGYNHPTIPNSIVPTYRPVLGLESVSSGAAVFVRDTASAIAYSVQSGDYFQFTSAPVFPVQISYLYDAQAAALQNLYNNPAYAASNQQPVTTPQIAVRVPLLARAAQALGITYTVAILVMPNYNGAQVRAAVVAALQALAATWDLATQVSVGELNDAVIAVPGVLQIAGTGTAITFALAGQTGVAVQGITAANNQYPVLQTINIF